ncbi:LacI family DNA-binding transcriptional regulator [Candidatus Leptofilum sp.]|uniref:LacI family DNA-binding transcriptional regulator n=1 Tax=Candidatus Leptofilum sp. TaxID=3241576 RepID=UPI003B5A8111
MAVTIQDIANHLNLAPSTVSKALNDYPHIAPNTRNRVLTAARELDYVPSAAARNLRRRRTDKIGFSFSFPFSVMSDYVSGLIAGAVTAAEEQGYNLTLYPLLDNQVRQLTQICRAREVDGLLLLGRPQMAETTLPLLKQEGIPFVLVGRWAEDQDISFVKPDDPNGAVAVTRHLIELGHRRIGFTTRPSMGITSRDRFAGYKQALEEANIPFDKTLVVETNFEPESSYLAMNQLLELDDPPTAVFAIHDLVAVDCLRAALDRGLRVPQDIAIAGFDDWRISLTTQPPLTTVQAPLEKMGARATDILLTQISNPNRLPERLILPVELIVRQSTKS